MTTIIPRQQAVILQHNQERQWPPRQHRKSGSFAWNSLKVLFLAILLLAIISLVAAPATTYHDYAYEEDNLVLFDTMGARLRGIGRILVANPTTCFGALLRIAMAIFLEISLDGFLKTVVTPAIAGTGIGILVTPLTFFIGQALQPIIHSVSFLIFDDRFLDIAMESTGTKQKLVKTTNGKWHRLSLVEGIITRHCLKVLSAWCVGLAGLCTLIPVLGPILTALLSGWIVAWDYVYVPLSGMGYVGFVRQFWVVYRDFRRYYWFGFWAVLLEEIPLAGPVMHVYNIYSATFLLEDLYWNGAAAATSSHAAMINTTIAAVTGHKEL